MEHPKNKLAKCIALRNIRSAVLECSEHFRGRLVQEQWDLENQRYPKDISESVNFAWLSKLQCLHPTAIPALQFNLAVS